MIVNCPHCSSRFDVQEQLLLPSGKKLKCSKCKKVFFQEPPPAKPVVSQPVSLVDDLDQFDSDTVIGFSDADKRPVDSPPPSPAKKKIADKSLEASFNTDDDEFGEEARTRLSEDDLARLMAGASGGEKGKGSSLADELGISDETLMALEEQEANFGMGEEISPPAPRAKVVPERDKTLMAMLDDAYPDEDLKHPANPSIVLEEIDPSFDDLPTLIAPQKPGKKLVKAEPPAKEKIPAEPDFDSLIAELENNRDSEEIDLDAETFVASRAKPSASSGGLSSEEEEALASLGFNPGLSHDEEEALGSLGLRGNKPMERLSDDDEDDDLVPTRARNPAPPPSSAKGASYASKPKLPIRAILWGVVALLGLTLILSVLYTRTGMREWLEYKSFDLDNPFRIVSLQSHWVEKDYGQLLVVEGNILNTTSLSHVVPMVKVMIMDKENNVVADTTVVPGRLLGEKDMEGTQDTLRTIIQMQGDTKRMKPPKVNAKKEMALVAIFINPPEGADRFQTEFVYLNQETSRTGGTKTFQSIF